MKTTTTPDGVDACSFVVGTSEVHEQSLVAFRDEVDAAVERYLAHRRQARGAPVGPLVVDLGWVTFLDEVGVPVLLEATERVEAAGGAIRFRNAAGAIRLVLEGAGRWGEVHGPNPASQPHMTVTPTGRAPAAPPPPSSGPRRPRS